MTDLYLLRGLAPALRALVLLLAVAASVGIAYVAVRLQQHFLAEQLAGQVLNPWAALIASGSSAGTAWPGWVATLCFGIAIVTLRRSDPEPPAGRERRSVSELRAGLRSEYRAVRIALVVVTLLAVIDVARMAITVIEITRGQTAAPGETAFMPIEAAGIAAAALALAVWARCFRSELERWGAL